MTASTSKSAKALVAKKILVSSVWSTDSFKRSTIFSKQGQMFG